MSTYRPLSGSFYVKLPAELKSLKKELINITNNNQKYFLWCHVRHINPVKKYIQKELGKPIKNLTVILVMMDLNFICEKKILARFKQKAIFVSMCFAMISTDFANLHFRSIFKNSIDLSLLIDETHFVYIKYFDRFMFHNTKDKNKKYFCKSCLQCFSSKNVLTIHQKLCLSINGA